MVERDGVVEPAENILSTDGGSILGIPDNSTAGHEGQICKADIEEVAGEVGAVGCCDGCDKRIGSGRLVVRGLHVVVADAVRIGDAGVKAEKLCGGWVSDIVDVDHVNESGRGYADVGSDGVRSERAEAIVGVDQTIRIGRIGEGEGRIEGQYHPSIKQCIVG